MGMCEEHVTGYKEGFFNGVQGYEQILGVVQLKLMGEVQVEDETVAGEELGIGRSMVFFLVD